MRQTTALLPALVLAPALMISTGRAQAAPFDQAFLDSMTPHHAMATEMAQIAVQKARYPEVKAFARTILRDQSKEIAQMRAWRQAWYGAPQGAMHHMSPGKSMPTSHGTSHSMHGMTMKDGKMTSPGTMMGLPIKMEMDMGALRKAHGAQVNKLFLSMMIPHHASGIVMADEATRAGQHPQLRTLAHSIIDAQAKEIGTMRTMYARHFGKL